MYKRQVLFAVATVAARTTIDHGEGAFSDDEEDWEDDEDHFEDDVEEDDEDDDNDY